MGAFKIFSLPSVGKKNRKPDHANQRGSRERRFYCRKAWRSFRKSFLSENPFCCDCNERGVLTPAFEVHHVVPLRADWDLRLDVDNVMALCSACHGRRTRLEGRPNQ